MFQTLTNASRRSPACSRGEPPHRAERWAHVRHAAQPTFQFLNQLSFETTHRHLEAEALIPGPLHLYPLLHNSLDHVSTQGPHILAKACPVPSLPTHCPFSTLWLQIWRLYLANAKIHKGQKAIYSQKGEKTKLTENLRHPGLSAPS